MNEKEELKKQLLQTLCDFDAICREEGIKYSLHGGTLLGAIRNGKFIPWDDDIDVSMTRENFERLEEVCRREKTVHIAYSKIAPWIPRIYGNSNKIPIDILIYDYICENKLGQSVKGFVLAVLQCFLKQDVQLKYKSVIKKITVAYLRKAGSFFSEEKIKEIYTYIAKNTFTGKKKKIHRSVDQFSALFIVLPKEVMQDFIYIPFEGKDFLVTRNFDLVLTTAYGENYLIPPSENERNTDHSEIRKMKSNYS